MTYDNDVIFEKSSVYVPNWIPFCDLFMERPLYNTVLQTKSLKQYLQFADNEKVQYWSSPSIITSGLYTGSAACFLTVHTNVNAIHYFHFKVEMDSISYAAMWKIMYTNARHLKQHGYEHGYSLSRKLYTVVAQFWPFKVYSILWHKMLSEAQLKWAESRPGDIISRICW